MKLLTSQEAVTQSEKAIRQMQKGIRRIQKRQNYYYQEFIEEQERKINKNKRQLEKIEKDRENLKLIMIPKENFEIYLSDTFQRRIFGNGVK